MSDTTPSSLFRIELLQEHNWVPWKRRVTAILRERALLKYADGTLKKPIPADAKAPTAEESEKITKWEEGDGRAQTQIELTLSDSQMIHIAGAKTSAEMWTQLKLVKEARGKLGILAHHRRLYRTVADESTDIVEHTTEMRRIQEELGMLGSVVTDEDFLMLLISSLPESWDQFTSAYLGSTGNNPTVTSHEFIAIILEENRRRIEKSGGSEAAMYGRNNGRAGSGSSRGNSTSGKVSDDVECWNCHKRGHTSAQCWSKGGGQEGKGPGRKQGKKKKERSNQAKDSGNVKDDVVEAAYHVESKPQFDSHFSRYSWLADSGTTSHISNRRETFSDFKPLEATSIAGIGSASVRALGRGTVLLDCKVNGKTITHQLKDTLYAPNAVNNLISISRLDDAGMEASFRNGKVQFRRKDGTVLSEGKKTRRLYLMEARARDRVPEQSNVAADASENTWDAWHKKMGHLGKAGLERLEKEGLVEGLTIAKDSPPLSQCDACIQAKMTLRPYPQEAQHRREEPGELAHGDIWGPARIESLQKSKYNITFTDDATRRCTPEFMKLRSEGFKKIKEYVTLVETQLKRTLKVLRVDNAKELTSEEVRGWLKQKGIRLQTSAPYAHSSNGVAERFNRTLVELARAMLIGRNLPSFLWQSAIEYAAYIRNRASTRVLAGKTPEEAWTGIKPSVAHLREFGCEVWVKREGKNLSKLGGDQTKAEKHTFVGFTDDPVVIKYYDVHLRDIRESRNYTWAEPSPIVDIESISDARIEGEPSDLNPQSPKGAEETSQQAPPDNTSMPVPEAPRRSSRITKDHDYHKINNPNARKPAPSRTPLIPSEHPPESANVAVIQSYLAGDGEHINRDDFPRSLAEAQASAEWPEWKKAMDEEMGMIAEMKTYQLEDLPQGRETVGCRWTYVKKYDEHGNVSRYKARLVAQGYSQIPGVDYTETFAPVVRLESVRAALGIAAIEDLEIGQMDIKGAYLNGELEEEIYMRQPPGYDDGSGRVCRLYKTLYGLKQSGREWNREFDRKLTSIGFSKLEVDHCVYKRVRDGRTVFLTVWVDDLLIFAETVKDLDEIKRELAGLFDVKDMGKPKKIIGIEIERDRDNGTISLSQQQYIDGILTRFGLHNASPVTTPLDPNVILRKRRVNEEVDPTIRSGYQSAIGSLMYAAICTRPDIAYAVQSLSQYSNNPGPEHWSAVKRVFRYLSGTNHLKLTFRANEEHEVLSAWIYRRRLCVKS